MCGGSCVETLLTYFQLSLATKCQDCIPHWEFNTTCLQRGQIQAFITTIIIAITSMIIITIISAPYSSAQAAQGVARLLYCMVIATTLAALAKLRMIVS